MFERVAIKGDRIHYTTHNSSELANNTPNSYVWGDEEGKHVCHPATAGNVSSPGVNLRYRTTDSPAHLEFRSGARRSHGTRLPLSFPQLGRALAQCLPRVHLCDFAQHRL